MRRNVLKLVAVMMMALLGPLAVVSPAGAAKPDRDERLTFMRQDGSGFWQVWVSNADLTDEQQITSEQANSGWPVWSPDGSLIAFDSDRTDPDPTDDQAIYDVFTMRPDGTQVVKLTDSIGGSGDAAWSPDGTSIAFHADRGAYPEGQGIYVMRRDGTDVQRVTTVPDGNFDSAPRFSPGGNRLVFTRYGGPEGFGNAALHTVHVTGRHVRQITPFDIGAGDADWSPNGQQIVFEAYPSGTSRGDIYSVRANGGGLRNLTGNSAPNGAADPVWSADGRQILFLQAAAEGSDVQLGLATMDADGSRRAFVSSDPVESHQPDWHAVRGASKAGAESLSG